MGYSEGSREPYAKRARTEEAEQITFARSSLNFPTEDCLLLETIREENAPSDLLQATIAPQLFEMAAKSNGILKPSEKDRVGPRGQIRRTEFVRLLIQSLYSLGYPGAASLLEEESHVALQSASISCFRNSILEGNWTLALTLLPDLKIPETKLPIAMFLILQQNFLELLEAGNSPGALQLLRTELTPLRTHRDRLHQLASFVLSSSPEEVRSSAQWEGSGEASRTRLLREVQGLCPPAVMVPEGRLEALVAQALELQQMRCKYHNVRDDEFCLFVDHACGREVIPRETVEILSTHSDEVWCLTFSHDGTRLASASKDQTVIIWEILAGDTPPRPSRVQFTLVGHATPLSSLAWSPNDALLLTCSIDNLLLWDTASGECTTTFQKHIKEPTCCAWFPDSCRFVSGGKDSCLYLWDVEGHGLASWRGEGMPPVSDMAVTRDGKYVICVSGDKEIRIYSVDSPESPPLVISETNLITSLAMATAPPPPSPFSLSSSSSSSPPSACHILVNLTSGVIHAWELQWGEGGEVRAGGGVISPSSSSSSSAAAAAAAASASTSSSSSAPSLSVVGPSMRYRGQVRGRYVIRSCFGGSHEAFVVSGSEDCKVYIWHRGSGELLEALSGHSGIVNAVSWSPTNPHLFASASDDKTIRIWGIRERQVAAAGDSGPTGIQNGHF